MTFSVSRLVTRVTQPRVFVPLAMVVYFACNVLGLWHAANTPKGRDDLVSGDSLHYVQIAQTFAQGDFSMAYVDKRPHRQPLYPATLAPVYHFIGDDLFALGMVNVVFAVLTIPVVYFGVRRLWHRDWIAALAAVLFITNDFLFDQTTTHLLTEPLHVLLLFGIIFSFLEYLRNRKPGALALAAALTGLDYLARTNGLFVMLAMLAVVGLVELLRFFQATSRLTVIREALVSGVLALLVFTVVATPSWLPRLKYFGNPIDHGYLTNYLWVDTYEEGHVGQREAAYTWRDYAKNHTLGQAVQRGLLGFWEVVFDIPTRVEGVPILFILAMGGMVVAIVLGPPRYRALLLFAFIQLLPIMWTNMSNPTVRVPYMVTMPFSVVFAASFLAFLALVSSKDRLKEFRTNPRAALQQARRDLAMKEISPKSGI